MSIQPEIERELKRIQAVSGRGLLQVDCEAGRIEADLVAVDATCCRLMRLDPQRIPYLALGEHKRLGLLAEPEIEQIGEQISRLASAFATLAQFRGLSLERSA